MNQDKLETTKKQESLLNFLKSEIIRIGDKLTRAIPGFLDSVENRDRQRADFISKYRRIPLGCESFLVVLRKWNSYTPSLPGASIKKDLRIDSIGGGYFLYIQAPENELDTGYGLVIDPGYNFIHNFGDAGFCLDDVDGIFITHAHNDHTNDFESLLTLLYQRNNKYIGIKKPKIIDLFMNVGSFKKFSNYLDLASRDTKRYINHVNVLSPEQAINIPNRPELDCEILTLHADHHEIVTSDYALGICIKMYGRNILFTGDSGWTFDTSAKNEEFLNKHDVFTRSKSTENTIDILVSHIGTIKRHEFPNDQNEIKYYDKHLGILGTLSILEQWKPDLNIISEFGEELADIREDLAKEIEVSAKKFYHDIRCIPGDVGLFVLLDSKSILCYLSGKPVNWQAIEFKDVTDKLNQKTIKYFSAETLARLVDKETILENLPTSGGLNLFRKYTREVIDAAFDLKGRPTAQLINSIAETAIDRDNRAAVDDATRAITGKLFALSCVLDDPSQLLDCIKNGHHSKIVSEILKLYHFDTSLLDDLSAICEKGQFEKYNKSAYEEILYYACKDNIEKFVTVYKINGKYEAEQVIKAMSNMIEFDINTLFENLLIEEKIELSQKHPEEVKAIDPYFEKILPFAQKYYDAKRILEGGELYSFEESIKVLQFKYVELLREIGISTIEGLDETGNFFNVLYLLVDEIEQGSLSPDTLNELNHILFR